MPLVLQFPSIECRDKFVDRVCTGRKCTDTPGLFTLPTGDRVEIEGLVVILYPADLRFPEVLEQVLKATKIARA